MFIRTNPGGAVKVAQPAAATLATAKAGRNSVILTNLTAGTNFYIHLGAGANDGAAGVGGTWTFILEFGKPPVVIDQWTGIITCDPAPTAGQINVAEILGSTFQSA